MPPNIPHPSPDQQLQSNAPGQPTLDELLNLPKPFHGDPRVEGFLRALFCNPYVHRAYFQPRWIPGLTCAADISDVAKVTDAEGLSVSAQAIVPTVIPMDFTLQAATHAAGMGLVKVHERALVHLAAIVYPCGLFLSSKLDGQQGAQSQQPHPHSDEVAVTRFMLLEPPLKTLKGLHVEMGNTLAAVLGQSYSREDVDLEQVSRLATAVQLANTRITALWTPTQPLPCVRS
jgi:hypothetical protein